MRETDSGGSRSDEVKQSHIRSMYVYVVSTFASVNPYTNTANRHILKS